MSRAAVIVFPGSNCEHDAVSGLDLAGASAELVWHTETDLSGYDLVVLPGGFAHGDYLRVGALARFSPIMDTVAAFAASGGPVVGICNGFQILTEAGMLPGALQKNAHLKFHCKDSTLIVASSRSVLTRGVAVGTELSIPINHFSGSYVCDAATLQRLHDNDQVVLRYAENPNGSLDDIAGISNDAGNVVGLMPHPERACSALLGSTDGLVLLQAFVGAAVSA